MVLSIIFSVAYVNAAALEKKVIVKGLILAKVDLLKNSKSGKQYAEWLDAFFIKYEKDSDKIDGILSRIPAIKSKLGSSREHQDILRIVNYIEYKALYLNLWSVVAPKPKDPTTWDTENSQTSININTIKAQIDVLYWSGSIVLKDIVGTQIANRTSTGSEWIIGYPDYSKLWIKKDDYSDSFDNEFFVVYHYITDATYWDQYYYQILGYTQTWDKQKTALVKWNYSPKNSTYPDSLFVDSDSKNAILDGDTFSIQ